MAGNDLVPKWLSWYLGRQWIWRDCLWTSQKRLCCRIRPCASSRKPLGTTASTWSMGIAEDKTNYTKFYVRYGECWKRQIHRRCHLSNHSIVDLLWFQTSKFGDKLSQLKGVRHAHGISEVHNSGRGTPFDIHKQESKKKVGNRDVSLNFIRLRETD